MMLACERSCYTLHSGRFSHCLLKVSSCRVTSATRHRSTVSRFMPGSLKFGSKFRV